MKEEVKVKSFHKQNCKSANQNTTLDIYKYQYKNCTKLWNDRFHLLMMRKINIEISGAQPTNQRAFAK